MQRQKAEISRDLKSHNRGLGEEISNSYGQLLESHSWTLGIVEYQVKWMEGCTMNEHRSPDDNL